MLRIFLLRSTTTTSSYSLVAGAVCSDDVACGQDMRKKHGLLSGNEY